MTLQHLSYGQGNPLLILHGFLGSSDNWGTQAKSLAEHFHVFVPDARNHGRSPHADEFDYAVMAEDIREFMRQHGLPATSLIGHSMGGKTAMLLALRYPELVRKLVVVDVAPKQYPHLHDEILEALTSLDLSRHPSRQEIDRALAVKIPSLTTRQFLMKNLARDEGGGFRWKMNLPVLSRNYDRIAEGIFSDRPFENPALFLISEQSGYVQDEDIPQIRELFPHSVFVGMNVGHWIHAEAPGEFVRIVTGFLKS